MREEICVVSEWALRELFTQYMFVNSHLLHTEVKINKSSIEREWTIFLGPLAASGVIVITAGVLVSYILGSLISWKICAWIFLSVHILMAILVFVIPESPSWMIHKKLYSKAEEALTWLGRDRDEFLGEVEIDFKTRLEKVRTSGSIRKYV